MPKLLFDPDNEFDLCKIGKPKRGGALTGANRCEYVELCKQITSRDPTLDYKAIGNRILEIMHADVLEYIKTLPEEDRQYLLENIDTFYSTINKNDKDIISTINTFGLQIAILFTKYWEYSDTTNLNNIDYNTIMDFYNNITMNDQWHNNTKLKNILADPDSDFYFLLNQYPDLIFFVFVGFVTLRELIESYFNNVFYCDLSYTNTYVDGAKVNPILIMEHDILHYNSYSRIYCTNYPEYINYLQNFYTYAMNTLSKPEQYAINFELFLDMHEIHANIPYLCKEGLNKLKEHLSDKSSIYNFLINNLEGLNDLNNLGKAIPKEYRVLLKNSNNKLDESKIKEYLKYVAETFVNCFKSFESQTGGRRNRKAKTKKRRAHKSRKTRKF